MKTARNPMLMLPGTKPGGTRTIKMHKAMASGAEMPETPRVVMTHQKKTTTGKVKLLGNPRMGESKGKS